MRPPLRPLPRACAAMLHCALALVLIGVGVGGCGGDAARRGASPSAAPRGATVVVPDAPVTLDPAKASSLTERAIAVATQTPLLTYRRTAGSDAAQLVPALAGELPTLSQDAREYRFQLRRGLVYADGLLVTASDVERAVAHASRVSVDPMIRTALRSIVGAPSRDGQTLRGVRTDDRTGVVVVRLRRPDGRIPLVLADPATAPLPALPRSGRSPASTGPLRIVRRTARSVELAANALRPTISTVPAARLAQVSLVAQTTRGGRAVTSRELDRGVVDLLLGASNPADGAPRGGVKQLSAPTTSVAAAYMPETSVVLTRSVRRALAAAIDRRVVEELPGSTLAACGLIPPPVVGAVDRDPCPATPLDPDRTLLRGTAAIRIAEPRGAWTPAALALATDAIASLGGSFRAVSSIDPIADVVGGRADLALVRVAPRLPHPSGWLAPAAQLDRLLAREVPRETAGPLRGSASRWAALERRAVDRAVAIPLLSLQRDAFVGPSIDARTVLLHPVLGIDLAALDLS